MYSHPVIDIEPVGVLTDTGSNATFSVTAHLVAAPSTATLTLGYQWKHGAALIPGATQSSFTTAASLATVGSYTVIVTNQSALPINLTTLSTAAVLTTNTLPSFTIKLANGVNKLAGTTNWFFFHPAGTLPQAWQWYFNGTPIGGATATNYAAKDLVGTNYGLTLADAGTYSVVASNIAGFSTNSATLTVLADTNRPTVLLTFPIATPMTSTNLNQLTAMGTATDTAQLTNVLYILNGVTNYATTTDGWKHWSAPLDGQLIPGTNVITVQAQDFSGNKSLIAATSPRKFFFALLSPLTIVTNGVGYGITSTNGPLELNQ